MKYSNVAPNPKAEKKAKLHFASGSMSNLTEKERAARKIQKTADMYGSTGSSIVSSSPQFYSAQLSTDFLELPQSARERRELFLHFYNSEPIVGQALDLHTELPMSKVRLATPQVSTCPEGFKDTNDYAKYILTFFQRMCKRIKLFQRLITGVHHYWLDGNSFFFAEDSVVECPANLGYERKSVKVAKVLDNGDTVVQEEMQEVERPDREELELEYYRKHYKGWSRLINIPMDAIDIKTFNFTDKVKISLIPSEEDRTLVQNALNGDPLAEEMVQELPQEVREHIASGQLIPLGTDPDEGSFVYHLHARKGADEDFGHSILERCLRTLIYRDKLRQSQTQIASRAMTPKRVVWSEGMSDEDCDGLREQIDLALVDPDYTIVANTEIHWEDIGARDRLLDLASEYEQTERHLLAGLGVTESLISGEALFSGDRLKLEVINTRYVFLREMVQEFVEQYLFEPVARRKGFVEQDAWGDEVVIYPKLAFTRMPLRDSQDTYDALFNLYSKGSISIDVILDMFNIDPHDTRMKIEKDMFTVNDSLFNEVLRSIYGEVGRTLATDTNVAEKIAEYLKLKIKAQPAAEESRF